MMIYHPGGIISFGSADAVLLHRATGGYKPGGGLPVHQGSGTHLTEAEDRHPNKFSGRFLQRSDRFRNLVQHIQMFEVPRQMFGAHDQMSGVRLRTNRPGHLLLIPYRHVADFFDAELAALLALVRDAKTLLDGYNIGQTVMHLTRPRHPPLRGGRSARGGPGEEGVSEGISPPLAHHHIFGSPSNPLSIR